MNNYIAITFRIIHNYQNNKMKKNEINFIELQSELLLYHNQLRTNPSSFIPILQEWQKRYKDNILQLNKESPSRTFEGEKGCLEAIKFLKTLKPLPELKYNESLSKAAMDHAADIGQYGLVGHEGSRDSTLYERIEKYMEWDGACAENLDFGFKNAENIILNMLIDDGDEERSQRKNMFDPRYKYIGIGCGNHRDYGYCSVFVYVKSLRNIGDPPNVGINYIQDFIKKTMGKKSVKNRLQEDDPDAPDDAESVKIIKCKKNILGHEKQITKKIYLLKDKTQHIVDIEEN